MFFRKIGFDIARSIERNDFKINKKVPLSFFATGTLVWSVVNTIQKDKERSKKSDKSHREEQARLIKAVELQLTTEEALLAHVEQLPVGKIPHPGKIDEAYTPFRSQELVLQGFMGGLLTLLEHPDQHRELVDACGIALARHSECIEKKGDRYREDRALVEYALRLPKEKLEERAKQQGRIREDYILMLNARLDHAKEGEEACKALFVDISHRRDTHRRLAEQYEERRNTFEKLLRIKQEGLSIILGRSDIEESKFNCAMYGLGLEPEDLSSAAIIDSAIGSAAYGLGLITGQTVVGLSGQIIDADSLIKIEKISKELGTHAMRLVSHVERSKQEDLTPEKRNAVNQTIQDEAKKNNKMMRLNEFAFIMEAISAPEFPYVKTSESAQALAHGAAGVQGPQNILGNTKGVFIVGAAVPLFAQDILGLHHQSPHCLHEEHGEGLLEAVQKPKKIPGMLQRIGLSARQGTTSWLINDDSNDGDFKRAFNDLRERWNSQLCKTTPPTPPTPPRP